MLLKYGPFGHRQLIATNEKPLLHNSGLKCIDVFLHKAFESTNPLFIIAMWVSLMWTFVILRSLSSGVVSANASAVAQDGHLETSSRAQKLERFTSVYLCIHRASPMKLVAGESMVLHSTLPAADSNAHASFLSPANASSIYTFDAFDTCQDDASSQATQDAPILRIGALQVQVQASAELLRKF